MKTAQQLAMALVRCEKVIKAAATTPASVLVAPGELYEAELPGYLRDGLFEALETLEEVRQHLLGETASTETGEPLGGSEEEVRQEISRRFLKLSEEANRCGNALYRLGLGLIDPRVSKRRSATGWMRRYAIEEGWYGSAEVAALVSAFDDLTGKTNAKAKAARRGRRKATRQAKREGNVVYLGGRAAS